jgi:hypothetical protein
VHQQIMSRFDNVPSACASLFDQLACVYCSPESSLFITSTPTSFDLMHICESYCNRFYTTCASAVIRGTGQVRCPSPAAAPASPCFVFSSSLFVWHSRASVFSCGAGPAWTG